MKKNFLYYALIISMIVCGCKDKYLPPVIQSNLRYLVVDGTLINGNDSTIIRLSRTGKLDESTSTAGEQNARMTVEDATGNTLYNFTEINSKGVYAVAGMNLDVNQIYRLRINTADGNQYVSDDIPIKNTPPIDSINWQLRSDGLTIYANTHDVQKSSNYYRWDYAETWDYYTTYLSVLKYKENAATIPEMFPPRTAEEFVYHCWKTVYSDQILTTSTTRLTEDRVNLFPIRFIPTNSFELSSIYSIIVKQYTLTKEAFDYFENIKRITEKTGSIFDAQPSELNGNIHCLNNTEQRVIGFLTGCSLQQQRIYIKNDEVRPWRFDTYCPPLRKVPLIPDSLKYYFSGSSPMLTPIEAVYDPFFTGINGGLPVCSDCLSRGGANLKPDFWPY